MKPKISVRKTYPHGVCVACYRTWMAKPDPEHLLYCTHTSTVARRTSSGTWKTIEGVTAGEVDLMRVLTTDDRGRPLKIPPGV